MPDEITLAVGQIWIPSERFFGEPRKITNLSPNNVLVSGQPDWETSKTSMRAWIARTGAKLEGAK